LQREAATGARATPPPETLSLAGLAVVVDTEVTQSLVVFPGRVIPAAFKVLLFLPSGALAAAVPVLLVVVGTARRGATASHHPSRERPLLAQVAVAVGMKMDLPEQVVAEGEARAAEMLRVPLERQTQAVVAVAVAVELRAEMAETAVLA